MAIIRHENFVPDPPCLFCNKLYTEEIWPEQCCDEKECIYDEDTLQTIKELNERTYENNKECYVSLEDLLHRFIEINIEFKQSPWNLKQILNQLLLMQTKTIE